MKIVVCIRLGTDGEPGPFDACAYEAALQVNGAEVILLSMAPEKSKEMLLNLTRLGAKEAYLLCDKAFAGSDTLATSYVLSLAIKKIGADLVFCGRQTVDGDTGQVGPGVSEFLQYNLITNVLEIKNIDENILNDLFTTYKKGMKGQFGLGLSIVKKTVAFFGYEVSVKNEKKGVTFLIK